MNIWSKRGYIWDKDNLFFVMTCFMYFLGGSPFEADNIDHTVNCPIIDHSSASYEQEL